MEAVLNHRPEGKKLEYLVKFKDHKASWQPEQVMNEDIPHILEQYWAKYEIKRDPEAKIVQELGNAVNTFNSRAPKINDLDGALMEFIGNWRKFRR